MSLGQEVNNYTVVVTNATPTITITQDMGVSALSIRGDAAVVSTVQATPQNPTQAIGTLPVAGPINIPLGSIVTFQTQPGRFLDNIVITIPAGGTLSLMINQ